MKSVVFTFHEHASEENQDRLRTEILDLPGVHNVGRISPEAKKPALRRLWYAEVGDEKAASDLVERLRQHQDIRTAELPAERSLS
jgi:cell division protein FtsX